MNQYPAYIQPATRKYCARRGHPFDMPVVAGTDLCLRCHNRFPLNVEALVDAWPTLLSSVVKRPGQGDSEKVSTSGHGDVGGLWNPAAVVAINEITEWAAFVTRTIVRERPVPPAEDVRVVYVNATSKAAWDEKGRRYTQPLDLPARQRAYSRIVETVNYTQGIGAEKDPRGQLAAIAQWHARWLTSYPTMGPGLVDDVLRFREHVTNAIQAVGVRRIELPNAYCRHIVEETDLGPIECRGALVGVLRPDHYSEPSEIVCSANPSHRRLSVEEWILAR